MYKNRIKYNDDVPGRDLFLSKTGTQFIFIAIIFRITKLILT